MVPQLDTSYWCSQIIWLVICLSILVVFFKKIFLPKISASITIRDNHIKTIKRSMDELAKEYENLAKELNSIDEKKIRETQRILNETKAKCDIILNEQIKNLDLKNKNTIFNTKKEADELIKNLDTMIKKEIDNTSQRLFEKLFGGK